MTSSIYVTATKRGSGKSTVSLGLVHLLERSFGRVGFFKPIGNRKNGNPDPDVKLMKEALGLEASLEDMAPVTLDEVAEALAGGTYDRVIDRLLEAYSRIAAGSDFVVCEGTDYFGAMASFEFNINADLSNNLSAPILLVENAQTPPDEEGEEAGGGGLQDRCEALLNSVSMVKESFDEKACDFFGVVINRADPKSHKELAALVDAALARQGIRLLGVIPRAEMLERIRIEEVVSALDAEVLSGSERLNAVAQDIAIAAMSLANALTRIPKGSLVLTPGDRDDVVLALAAAYASPVVASPCGVVLTGGLEPSPPVRKLVNDLTEGRMPIIKADTDTYETAVRIHDIQPSLKPHHRMRIDVVIGLTELHLDVEPIVTRSAVGERSPRVTPKQFIHRIVDLARAANRHIVLPEGKEERILRAAHELRERRIVELTLLGGEDDVRRQIARLGLNLEGVSIVDPSKSPLRERFAKRYIELRSPSKTPTWDHAFDVMADPSYFGTMMVQEGIAHGMVSGSINTTAHTLRPALEFVKTVEGFSIASSVFFMCLPDQVLVYGDCAVNPNPTAEQLADIALASAETARAFEIEPYVAMLSYSTGDSGKGSDVDKVREATRIVKEKNPALPVEGPIQYDAAVDPAVAKTKLPKSRVAGSATVFIFPDLNSGNNTYKAVQRAARAIAVGPVMQGLRKPVNDLSRGCTIPDIVNTVAITAIQAHRAG